MLPAVLIILKFGWLFGAALVITLYVAALLNSLQPSGRYDFASHRSQMSADTYCVDRAPSLHANLRRPPCLHRSQIANHTECPHFCAHLTPAVAHP